MSREDIREGLRNGDIVRPARLPDWATGRGGPATPPDPIDPVPEPASNVDRERVGAWFKALDPDLSDAGFEAIWSKAGATDLERAAKLASRLSGLLLEQHGDNDAAALDDYFASGSHRASVVDLAGKTGEELAVLGKTDIGVRYALAHLDSFALTGNRALFANANADSSLDRFDGDTGEALLSDAWLRDRGRFVAWKLREDSGEPMAIAGDQDWTFVDRGVKGAGGQPLELEIRTGAADAGRNQVVFGTAEDEVFKGVGGSDRIYAGAGDDVLRGGRGGDHLEGGDGDDLVMGGAGNDEVLGGRGNDELDGGSGLDRLEGGSGDDTYVIAAGDGADTILDADGVGTIELDGNALHGTMQGSGGKWVSDDGKLEFTFEGNLDAGGTLTISAFTESADHDGPAGNTITVNDWKNGDLGITLAADADDDLPPPSPLDVLTGPEVPVVSSADLPSETPEDPGAPSREEASEVASHAEGDAAIEASLDVDAALDSLLGDRDATVQAVDRMSYRQAIDAFAGVLQVPDVPVASNFGDSTVVGAVTETAMSDALAADCAALAFDSFEPPQARAVPSVDMPGPMELWRGVPEVRDRAGA
jgi:Ca2+-binding RTX toxin-like protein